MDYNSDVLIGLAFGKLLSRANDSPLQNKKLQIGFVKMTATYDHRCSSEDLGPRADKAAIHIINSWSERGLSRGLTRPAGFADISLW